MPKSKLLVVVDLDAGPTKLRLFPSSRMNLVQALLETLHTATNGLLELAQQARLWLACSTERGVSLGGVMVETVLGVE
jgi:hypothetical protein